MALFVHLTWMLVSAGIQAVTNLLPQLLMNPQLIISIITIVGSGISVYIGMRVALAEIKKDIENLRNKDAEIMHLVEKDLQDMRSRVNRLEDQHFNHRSQTRA